MKTFVTFALLIGVSILHISTASADITDIQCDTQPTSVVNHVIPSSCSVGDIYDIGDVTIDRTCSYVTDGNTQFPDHCVTSWIESYFHVAASGCTDGGFVEQADVIIRNNCPF